MSLPAKMITSVEMKRLNKYQLTQGGAIQKGTNSPAKKTMNEPLGPDNLG